MECILLECDAPGRTQIWELVDELRRMRSNQPLPSSYGGILGWRLTMYTKNNRLFKIIMSESAHPYNPEAKMRETHSEGRRPTEVPLGTGNPQPMGTDVVLQLLHQKKKKKRT